MSNIINYTAKCGLPITIIKNSDYSSIYAGIGCKFGGGYLSANLNGKEISIKPGVAHFLEHKKFSMPNGADAMEDFSRFGDANAFTSRDKTVYFFENVVEYKESLKTLLTMYFTPHFDPKEINKEKSIILNEYRDCYDDVYFKIEDDIRKMIYPNDDYTLPLLGKISDIKSITSKDLEDCYSMFYTPKNSHLVISGNVDDNIIEYIESILDGLLFSNVDAKKNKYIKSTNVLKPKTKYYDIYDTTAYIMLRMDSLTSHNPIVLDKIGAILDSTLLENCEFYNELYTEGLVNDDIDYYIDCHEESTYIEIEAKSDYPSKLARRIIDKFNNLEVSDIKTKQVTQYIKYKKKNYIEAFDSIYKIGKSALNEALENNDYFKLSEEVMNLTYDDVIEIIEPLKASLKTYLIAKPKKV